MSDTPKAPTPPSVPGPRVGTWRDVNATIYWLCSCSPDHNINPAGNAFCMGCQDLRPPLPASDAPTPAGERVEAARAELMGARIDETTWTRDWFESRIAAFENAVRAEYAALRAAPRGEPVVEADCRVMARWIRESKARTKDGACAQCFPESEYARKARYVCALHIAEKYPASPDAANGEG